MRAEPFKHHVGPRGVQVGGRRDGLLVREPLQRERMDERATRIARLGISHQALVDGSILIEDGFRQDVGVFYGHRRALRQMRREYMRGIAADHDAALEPGPWQQHRLDGAVDDVGLGPQRCADVGDVAAVLRETFPQMRRQIGLRETRVARFGADVEDVHQRLRQGHRPGLAADPLQKFHACHLVGSRYLQPPRPIAGRPGHEGRPGEVMARRRPHAVEAGDEVEGAVRAIRKDDLHDLATIVDRVDGEAGPDGRASARRRREEDIVQVATREGANGGDARISHQEGMIDDQPPIGIEDLHAVVDEAFGENLVQHAEGFVDAQRIGRLPQPDARHIERRPPLDEHDVASPLRQNGRQRQTADPATDDEDVPYAAHHIDSLFFPACKSPALGRCSLRGLAWQRFEIGDRFRLGYDVAIFRVHVEQIGFMRGFVPIPARIPDDDRDEPV